MTGDTREDRERSGTGDGAGHAGVEAGEAVAGESAGAAAGEGAGRGPGGPDGAGGAAPPPGSGPEPDERMGAVDWIYGTLVQPRATFGRLAAMSRPPLGLAVAVALVIMAATGLVQGAALLRELANPVVPGEEALLPPDLAAQPAAAAVTGVLLAVFSMAMWWGWAAILHLLADLLGGSGRGGHLLAALGLATVPQALSLPLEAVAARLGGAGHYLTDAGALVLGVWTLVLQYRAVRATKGLNRAGALLALFLPLVVIFAATLFLVLVIIVAAAGLTLGA